MDYPKVHIRTYSEIIKQIQDAPAGDVWVCNPITVRCRAKLILMVSMIRSVKPCEVEKMRESNAPFMEIWKAISPEKESFGSIAERIRRIPFHCALWAYLVLEANVNSWTGFLRFSGSDQTIYPINSIEVADKGRSIYMDNLIKAESSDLIQVAEDRTFRVLGGDAKRVISGIEIAVVGASRTGSLLAHGLLRLGVPRIRIIDPDYLELHHLRETDLFHPEDVGNNKAECLAARMKQIFQHVHVEAIAESIASKYALQSIRSVDMIATCVDNDSARLCAGLFSQLYMIPHLDVATGIYSRAGGIQGGGDIRLILPGNSCMLCTGGIANIERLVENHKWRARRDGSLRSINQISVGFAIHLIERWLMEDIQERSIWLRLEWEKGAHPRINSQQWQKRRRCPLCSCFGRGDQIFLNEETKEGGNSNVVDRR